MPAYPISYFTSIFKPKKIFTHRRQIPVWQKLLTSLFLLALLVIPSSLQIAQLKTYPLDNLVEGIFSPLTPEVMADLQQAQIEDGQLIYSGASHEQVYTSDSPRKVGGFSYQWSSQGLIIRKDQDKLVELAYSHFSTADFTSTERLSQAISQAWFEENRVATSFLLIGASAFLLAVNFFLLVLGASLILYLISRSRFFDFKTFGEAYQFSLNCLGLPSFLAFLLGLLGQPIHTMILAQNMLFVLLLVWVFYKTRFQDED